MAGFNHYTRYKQSTPPWIEKKRVAWLYNYARKHGYHVDHIIPINGQFVCGLHCYDNLQLLQPQRNIKKSNQWPEQLSLFDYDMVIQHKLPLRLILRSGK